MEKEITDDELRQAEEAVQKITDKYVLEVDAVLEVKEKDLLEV